MQSGKLTSCHNKPAMAMPLESLLCVLNDVSCGSALFPDLVKLFTHQKMQPGELWAANVYFKATFLDTPCLIATWISWVEGHLLPMEICESGQR
jgi:hypothetical protein